MRGVGPFGEQDVASSEGFVLAEVDDGVREFPLSSAPPRALPAGGPRPPHKLRRPLSARVST